MYRLLHIFFFRLIYIYVFSYARNIYYQKFFNLEVVNNKLSTRLIIGVLHLSFYNGWIHKKSLF